MSNVDVEGNFKVLHRVCIYDYPCFTVELFRAHTPHRVFTRDVTAAMLVYPINPPGIELYYHVNVFFCFLGKARLLIT